MSGRKPALGADLVIPALALAFAGYFFVSISDLAWEAKSNGVIIGTLLVALVVAQVVRIALKVARGEASLGFDALYRPREVFVQRLALVAITIVFIVAMPWLGLTLDLFAGMLAALYVVGVRRKTVLLGVSFTVAAVVYLLFIAALDSAFPHGPIEAMLAPLWH